MEWRCDHEEDSLAQKVSHKKYFCHPLHRTIMTSFARHLMVQSDCPYKGLNNYVLCMCGILWLRKDTAILCLQKWADHMPRCFTSFHRTFAVGCTVPSWERCHLAFRQRWYSLWTPLLFYCNNSQTFCEGCYAIQQISDGWSEAHRGYDRTIWKSQRFKCIISEE